MPVPASLVGGKWWEIKVAGHQRSDNCLGFELINRYPYMQGRGSGQIWYTPLLTGFLSYETISMFQIWGYCPLNHLQHYPCMCVPFFTWCLPCKTHLHGMCQSWVIHVIITWYVSSTVHYIGLPYMYYRHLKNHVTGIHNIIIPHAPRMWITPCTALCLTCATHVTTMCLPYVPLPHTDKQMASNQSLIVMVQHLLADVSSTTHRLCISPNMYPSTDEFIRVQCSWCSVYAARRNLNRFRWSFVDPIRFIP